VTSSAASNPQLRTLYQRERDAEQPASSSPSSGVGPIAPTQPPPLHAPHQSVSNQVSFDVSRPAVGAAGGVDKNSVEVTSAAPGARTPGATADRGPVDESMLLDAYWASHGGAATRAILRHAPTRESIAEVVIGDDDRTQVTNTSDYPWRAIASLLITAADGSTWIGTAWFVAPRMLVTAGHCVFMSDQGGWVQQIEVIPGRQGDLRPFGSCFATAFRSVTGWIQGGSREYDYGAILLDESCRLGDQVGWYGYQTMNDSDLSSLTVNIAGYPGDKPVGTQWFHSSGLSSVSDRVLTYQIDTAGGQSGAPVWMMTTDGDRYGVGIHTNGDLAGNSATRIVAEVYNNFQAWAAEVP
jgi:glutamyl endopeptidase